MTPTQPTHTTTGVSEAMVERALAEWSKPNDRRDPADIMRAALSAALSPRDGVPGITVTINRMGWEETPAGERVFTATAVFTEPPNWPVNIAWGQVPVRMIPLSTASSSGRETP